MSATGDARRELTFHYVLDCPCGTTLTGVSEDEIVQVSFAHLNEKHPDMANDYEREHIVVLARRVVAP
jgi:hypothetical protein